MADATTLVLSSSFLAAGLTQILGWGRDLWKRREDKKYAELYLAAALSEYATKAAMAIEDDENYESSDCNLGAPLSNVPELPPLPDTINWRALGTAMTKEMLTFPVELSRFRAMVAFEKDLLLDDEDISRTIREFTARAALKALYLSAKLEAGYAGEPVTLDDGTWNAKVELEKTLTKCRNARLEARRASNEIMKAVASAQGDNAEAEPA